MTDWIEKAVDAETPKKDKAASTKTEPAATPADVPKEPAEKPVDGISKDKAARLLKERGWIEIYSSVLDMNIYLVQDKASSRWKHYSEPPNPELVRYTAAELLTLKGLSPDEVRFMHKQKVDFGGILSEPPSYPNGWEKVYPVEWGADPYWQKGDQRILVADAEPSFLAKLAEYKKRKKFYEDCKINSDEVPTILETKAEGKVRLKEFAKQKADFLAKKKGK